MITRDIALVLEEYRNTETEQGKSEIERLILSKYLTDVNSKDKLKKLTELLNAKISEVDQRRTLRHVEPQTRAVLWNLIDQEKMSRYTVLRLFRDAKALSIVSKTPIFDTFQKILSGYLATDCVSKSSTGKTFRKRTGGRLPEFDRVRIGRAKPSVQQYVSFWANIRELFTKEIAKRLVGLESTVAESLWKETEVELKFVLDTLQKRIQYTKRQCGADLKFEISRRDIIAACKTLHMDPPKAHGYPIDMKLARSNKHKLVRLYHPDLQGGNERNRPRYEAVVESYDLLSRYMDTLSPRIKEMHRNKEASISS